MNSPQCMTISAPRDISGRCKAAEEIAKAYELWKTGKLQRPIFIIPPEADPEASNLEVESLGGAPEGTGVLLRTSGSTSGQGKIVALAWESLEASASTTHDYFGGAGTWINVLPIYHIAGFQTVFRAIFAGFEPIIGDFASFTDFRRATLHSTAPRHYLSQVPTQLARLLETAPAADFSTAAHPSLADYCGIDVNLVGGASIRTDLLTRAHTLGIRTVTSYGMTETCGGCVYDGFPLGDVRISLTSHGRISIGSKVVALGYVGQSSAPEFSTDPTGLRWHHTRDWGKLNDGILSVNGRIDDAITTGGLTVIPQLLEDAISSHFHTQCVVLGIPDATWGEAVIAVTAKQLDSQSVKDFVKNRFERGWAPRKIYPLSELLKGKNQNPAEFNPTHKSTQMIHTEDLISAADNSQPSFPLTTSGKIDRRKVTQLVQLRYGDTSER